MSHRARLDRLEAAMGTAPRRGLVVIVGDDGEIIVPDGGWPALAPHACILFLPDNHRTGPAPDQHLMEEHADDRADADVETGAEVCGVNTDPAA